MKECSGASHHSTTCTNSRSARTHRRRSRSQSVHPSNPCRSTKYSRNRSHSCSTSL